MKKARTPAKVDVHPELDETPLLDIDGLRDYQMLIGMGQWLSVIGCFDICFAVLSLSIFLAAPHEEHLIMAKKVFGYLKKYPNKSITLDSAALPDASQ